MSQSDSHAIRQRMRLRRTIWLWPLCAVMPASASTARVRHGTVYHLSEGLQQAQRALLFINNHLSADDGAQIAVVGHAAGVDFMLDDPDDDDSFARAAAIRHLLTDGRVRFLACAITLTSRRIDVRRLVDGVQQVHSGVAEIARLQAVEGYAYLRP